MLARQSRFGEIEAARTRKKLTIEQPDVLQRIGAIRIGGLRWRIAESFRLRCRAATPAGRNPLSSEVCSHPRHVLAINAPPGSLRDR